VISSGLLISNLEIEHAMNNKYFIEVAADAQQMVQILEDKIYEHNSSSINKFDGALFSRIVRNDKEEIIAGIAGWTWAGACEITLLWVHEESRLKGIAKLLLQAAEEEARIKKCSIILVKSYSFQAPQFYERHGFLIAHTIDNFPQGFRYYTLTKKI
jgi:GNAT superfamily N-acetyltransferase